MIKYRTNVFLPTSIISVDVYKESAHFITTIDIDRKGKKFENREKKESGTHRYWDSFEAARSHLVEVAEKRLINLQLQTSRTAGELQEIKKMIGH